MKHDVSEKIIYPEGTSFLQYVADNTDHDLATLDGKKTHHGLGSIAVANGNFANVTYSTQKIQGIKKKVGIP